MLRESELLELAYEAGFDLAGLAPLRPPGARERFEAWLDAGRHAGMDWLERNRERIGDPRKVLPEGRSLLIVGLGHARRAPRLSGGGRVARYAAGRDYHNLMGKKLRQLGRRLEALGVAGRRRAIVDAGPLLERSHAAEAGLGFESKAANLLNARFGPWFFLGELLLEVELEPTPGPAPGSCGTCTACLDACPTGALVAPGQLDARLCISYHTIESRAPAPHELRSSFGEWAFGCDVCSEVCPWGQRAPDSEARYGTHPMVGEGSLIDWLRPDEAEFKERFNGSPLQRPGRAGLARNAALVLGNAPQEGGSAALLRALDEDPSPVVREATYWALATGYAGDRGVRQALAAARAREADPQAAAGMDATQG